MSIKSIGEAELLEILREAVTENGSQKAFARRAGVAQSYVNDLLHGRRPITEKIANALGYEKNPPAWSPIAGSVAASHGGD